MTPTAFRKQDVRAVDLLVIDEDGAVRQGRHRVFSEWQLHRSVYQARSDARAVVHAHPPFATSMACAGRRLDPSFMAEALVSLGPEIGWVPFEKPGATALGLAVQSVSQRCHAALLGQHGVLAWGSDLTMAMCRLELVEQLARIVVTSAARWRQVTPSTRGATARRNACWRRARCAEGETLSRLGQVLVCRRGGATLVNLTQRMGTLQLVSERVERMGWVRECFGRGYEYMVLGCIVQPMLLQSAAWSGYISDWTCTDWLEVLAPEGVSTAFRLAGWRVARWRSGSSSVGLRSLARWLLSSRRSVSPRRMGSLAP